MNIQDFVIPQPLTSKQANQATSLMRGINLLHDLDNLSAGVRHGTVSAEEMKDWMGRMADEDLDLMVDACLMKMQVISGRDD